MYIDVDEFVTAGRLSRSCVLVSFDDNYVSKTIRNLCCACVYYFLFFQSEYLGHHSRVM